MRNMIAGTLSVLAAVSCLVLPAALAAQDQQVDVDIGGASAGGNTIMGRLLEVVSGDNGAYSAETDENTLVDYLGYVVSVIFSLFGIIFVGLIIYAGYNWMTANGEKSRVSKASAIITAAILGLLVTIAAYAIWQFVFIRVIAAEV